MRTSHFIAFALALVSVLALVTACGGTSSVSHHTSHASYTDVSDARVKKCLPRSATNISLNTNLNGHFARYNVSETEFHEFLDELWEADNKQSVHQRDEMNGEGEPPNPEQFAQRFKELGWEPLENALVYHSPSKANGAITIYYYDADAGMAYHDTGYW